jgi:hypothetical protein
MDGQTDGLTDRCIVFSSKERHKNRGHAWPCMRSDYPMIKRTKRTNLFSLKTTEQLFEWLKILWLSSGEAGKFSRYWKLFVDTRNTILESPHLNYVRFTIVLWTIESRNWKFIIPVNLHRCVHVEQLLLHGTEVWKHRLNYWEKHLFKFWILRSVTNIIS